MAKKHIIKIGYQYFATDSVTAATQAVNLLSRMIQVEFVPRGDGYRYQPKEDESDFRKISLEMNQSFHDPKAKQKDVKPLALPAPKRGSILCICEKSYVAPKQHCPHCGRRFDESHNRTHSGTATQSGMALD